MIKRIGCIATVVTGVVISCAVAAGQQIADPGFNVRVDSPSYTKNFPRVLFDEAHNNFHTSTGRYKPFADLIFSDATSTGPLLLFNHQYVEDGGTIGRRISYSDAHSHVAFMRGIKTST